jgi:hypothetical protein
LDETRKLIDKALMGKLVSEGSKRRALGCAASRKAETTSEQVSLEGVAREESGDA